MPDFSSLTAMIIEPHTGMRASMHNMLNLCGITKIDHAVSSGTAIRPLRGKSYDLILCEYDLAEGQDGQQLLEDLRHNKIIPLATIFMMVTAERTYEKVVSAAELAPTDYLLKPFTADSLLERIARAVERREHFLPVYALMDEGDLEAAIEACLSAEGSAPKYAIDFMRLRAELHVTLGQAGEAEAIYRHLYELKAVAWARLGLAKTLFMQNRLEEAEELLQSLVTENKRFLDAYDWLAKAHLSAGRPTQAQEVLEAAVNVSPHAVGRLRRLGEVALETGDIETAERVLQQVVQKSRYSEFRDPEDHVKLVDALVQKGDTQQAAMVARDLNKSLGGTPKSLACRSLAAGMIHLGNGDEERAVTEFDAAVSACRSGTTMSNALKMGLARKCLEVDLEGGARDVMLDVMNNSSDAASLAKAKRVFEDAGRKDMADEIERESRKQVMGLVAHGADAAKRGDFKGAAGLMTEAARKFPNNPAVVFNAALALLRCLENEGWEGRMAEEARWYIEETRRMDPTNPRLAPLNDLFQSLLRKYGVARSLVPARKPQSL